MKNTANKILLDALVTNERTAPMVDGARRAAKAGQHRLAVVILKIAKNTLRAEVLAKASGKFPTVWGA